MTRQGGALQIEGRALRDDGTAVTGEVSLAQADGTPMAEAGCCAGAPGACSMRVGRGVASAHATTDGAGRFCFRVVRQDASKELVLAVPAQGDDSAASITLVADAGKRNPNLTFEPQTPEIVLDGKSETSIVARAFSEDEGVLRAEAGIEVNLFADGAAVAKATTSDDGMLVFRVSPAQWKRPGPSKLRLAHSGTADTSASYTEVVAATIARVDVAAEPLSEAVSPDDGFRLVVHASTGNDRATVDSGSVEASVDNSVVALAPIDATGNASLAVTFHPARLGPAVVSLRYLSSSKYFQAAPAQKVPITFQGPNPLRRWATLVGTLALALAAVAFRRTRQKTTHVPDTVPLPATPSEPMPTRQFNEIVGRIADFHDGTPVAHARVTLTTKDFNSQAVGETESDSRGLFRIAHGTQEGPFVLTIEAPLHRTVHLEITGTESVDVRPISRRRGLLEDLVRWAAAKRISTGTPPATPQEIARRAVRVGEDAAAPWVRSVQDAGFGRAAVDASREHDVAKLRPDAIKSSEKPDL